MTNCRVDYVNLLPDRAIDPVANPANIVFLSNDIPGDENITVIYYN